MKIQVTIGVDNQYYYCVIRAPSSSPELMDNFPPFSCILDRPPLWYELNRFV